MTNSRHCEKRDKNLNLDDPPVQLWLGIVLGNLSHILLEDVCAEGKVDAIVESHGTGLASGATDDEQLLAYRSLFRIHIDDDASIDDDAISNIRASWKWSIARANGVDVKA